MNRRELLSHSIPALGTISFLPTFLRSNSNTDEDLLAEAGLIRELDRDSFGWIWSILRNITKEELDWKINPEANSIRWILGHLTWFEEWACDAIEEKGLYLIDKQPTNSFQSDDFEEMRNRFTAAREKYESLTNDLSAGQIKRKSLYLYNETDKERAEVDLRTILAIHCTHFYGHLYQIRMIRGTYSRLNDTDKAKFDKW